MIDKENKLIIVAGCTGHQGGAVCRSLLKKGWRVIGLTRDPDKPEAKELHRLGVEVARCDLSDRQTLDELLPGAYGCFSVQAWWEDGIEGEIEQGRILADAAKAGGVQHFVYDSVVTADRGTGIPHFESKWQIEQYVRQLGLPATIFRPTFFMENFEAESYMQSILGGKLTLPLRPDTYLPMVAVDDIGAFVSMAFDYPTEWIGKTFSIAGDELTMVACCEEFSHILERPVEYVQGDISDMRRFSPELATMFEYFDNPGIHVDVSACRSMYPPLKTFDMWLREKEWHELGIQQAMAHAFVPYL
jgi:uncharacterized protein YbjT (DUF2867 family)